MVSFLALYRGDSVGTAELVAVSTDPDLVARFADEFLQRKSNPSADPIVGVIRDAERRALEQVRDEAEGTSNE